MKILRYLSFLFVLILLFSCTKNEINKKDKLHDCSGLFLISDTNVRYSHPSLKGQILFSWENVEGTWNYSIVDNLNISPARERVVESNIVSGEECLKYNLCHYAKGENIYWTSYPNLELEDITVKLSFPPQSVVEEIKKYCDSLELELIIEK